MGKRIAQPQSQNRKVELDDKVGKLVCLDLLFLCSNGKMNRVKNYITGLLCVDAFSGYKTIYWVEDRGQVEMLQAIVACIMEYRRYNVTIKTFRMDNEKSVETLAWYLSYCKDVLEWKTLQLDDMLWRRKLQFGI